MTAGHPTGAETCAHCGSALRTSAPFCNDCGAPVAHRPAPSATIRSGPARAVPTPPPAPPAPNQLVAAGRAVRSCAFLLDLAVLVSPALPFTLAAALLGVAEVVYVVIPVAAVAGWTWMSLWQGFTGKSFGKSMVGLRTISAQQRAAAGFVAVVVRGVVFAGTFGVAALPVLLSGRPGDGLHERLSGTTLIDITLGANPFGVRQQTALRKTIDRSLRRVSSPVPIGATHGTGAV